jgi:hypothetical protein
VYDAPSLRQSTSDRLAFCAANETGRSTVDGGTAWRGRGRTKDKRQAKASARYFSTISAAQIYPLLKVFFADRAGAGGGADPRPCDSGSHGTVLAGLAMPPAFMARQPIFDPNLERGRIRAALPR